MISVAEKRAAYEEARQLLLLGKKWQQLMPGERKPDFKRAAKAVIRRALGKTTVPREPDLDVHNGLMHEHAPREASLIERSATASCTPTCCTATGTTRSGRAARCRSTTRRRPASTTWTWSTTCSTAPPTVYPHGHMQGFGFVPSKHEVVSHVLLEDSVRPVTDTVPTRPRAPAPRAPVIMGDPGPAPSVLTV